MPHDLTCAEAEDLGYPERYAAGTLDDDAVARFEEHFLLCARCQESIALASTVRRTTHAAPRRTRRRRYVGGALVLAAAVAGLAVLRFHEPESVRALGRVETPPAYAGMAVRGAATPDDTAFAAAMTAYGAGDYSRAATQLGALVNAGVASPPVNFFLGASLLMTGQPHPAAAALAQVIAAGDTPYAADARYYRALALLQNDQPDSAEALLRAAVRDAGTMTAATQARDLLRRLEARRKP